MPSTRGLGVLLRVLPFPSVEQRCPHVPILQGIIDEKAHAIIKIDTNNFSHAGNELKKLLCALERVVQCT